MSAWFVLSSMGIYQVCPGDPNFSLGCPLFD
jgi:putative alpha-1,2-mannosidase